MAEAESAHPITLAFVGNPNCGKTTLFNALTGANRKTANWPGVTVEMAEGEIPFEGNTYRLLDLPGTYSLTPGTMEEQVTRDCLESGEADVIVNVVDATALERNLYLTVQLLELGRPMLLALNMMDLAEKRGIEIRLSRLQKRLGQIPAAAVSAKRRTGLEELLRKAGESRRILPEAGWIRYGAELEEAVRKTEEDLRKRYGQRGSLRWYAVKCLEGDEKARLRFSGCADDWEGRAFAREIACQRYARIREIARECLVSGKEESRTDRIDRWLLHDVWGLPIFLAVMAAVFFLTFAAGDSLRGVFEQGIERFSGSLFNLLRAAGVSGWAVSLILDGIVAGVGGILTFLPNIVILFLAMAVLEDSGYMARIACVMDGIMGKLGLSGRAFLPMLLGLGCTVPAVLATRTLSGTGEKRRAILAVPFVSCSARLPIYVLFSGMFFPECRVQAAYSMYLIGLLAAVFAARAGRAGDGEEADSLLIELPEYRAPGLRNVVLSVWEKGRDYLCKAGTVIFLASLLLWALLHTGPGGAAKGVSDSFAAALGKLLEPVLRPCGLGSWKIGAALLAGLSAKEAVVSSFAVLYGIGNINSDPGMAQLRAALAAEGFGAANAYALMVFCLLYSPCAAAVAAVRKETGSVRWTAGMAVFQMAVAWGGAALVYQAGSLMIG